MIKDNELNYMTVNGTNGAEIEIAKYEHNHKAVFREPADTEIIITINECESIALTKEDSLRIANKLLELLILNK